MKRVKWIAVLAAVMLVASMQIAPAQAGQAAPGAAAPAAPAPEQPAAPAPEVDKTKISQVIGANIGRNLKSQFEQDGIEIDKEALLKAFGDALAGAEPPMSDEEAQQTMRGLAAALPAMRKKVSDQNKAAGEAFLAENAKKEGIKTTTSGLQYRVIQEGTGATPAATDRVQVHYKGTLTDGREFDSSYKRGEPAEFNVNGVIPGWTEALQLMKEGGKMEIFVPANLAYGERPQQGIPSNSALVFEVELLKILPKQEDPKGVEIPTPGGAIQGQPQGQPKAQ